MVGAGDRMKLGGRHPDGERVWLGGKEHAGAANYGAAGQRASSVLEGDRVIAIRVLVDKSRMSTVAEIRDLPILTAGGFTVKLSQVADVSEQPGQIELRREDLRQLVGVTARLEGRDLGSAMTEIRQELSKDNSLRPGMV